MTSLNPIVEIMFDGVNWTDVTRYVRAIDGIAITRGRGDEQDDIVPGGMSLSLNNDGRFTPGLASGAYYPNVKKNRRIRARVIYWVTNLLTNSNFEAGITDWAAAGSVPPTLAQSNTHVQAGSQALRITWGTGGTGPAAQTWLYGLDIGTTYTASAYVYVPSGGAPAVRLGISGLSTGTASSTTNAFQRITYTFVATATSHLLQVTPSTSPTAGQQVWVDAAQVETGSAATTYSSTDAVISTRYDGYVNEWPVEWDGGENGVTISSITCTDLLKRLGGLAPMRSLLEEEFLYLDPDAYYTLGDEADSTSAGDTSGNGQESMKVYQVSGAGGSVTFGAEEGPGTDDLAAPRFTPYSFSQGKGLRANLTAATGSLVIACWINSTVGGRDFLQICNRFSGVGGCAFVLDAATSGTLQVSAFFGEDLTLGTFGAGQGFTMNLADGENHLVAVQIKADGGVFATIDNVVGSSGFSYGSIVTSAIDLYDRLVAGGFKDPTGGAANLFDGALSHIWYARRTTMPDWSNVWSAGNGVTESTTSRFDRLRTLLGLTSSVKGSSTTQMSAQAAGGITPLQALRDVAAVEGGLLYASRSAAEVVLECRNYRYNKASSITLTTGDFLNDLRWSDDDQLLVNDWTNRRDSGADQRVKDQASIDLYGVYADGDSQPWASDYDALSAAQWKVDNGADPPPRVTQVSVAVKIQASYTTVLGLDISDVITLSGLPATSPATSVAVHIEGYSETIRPNDHVIAFNTSPAAVNDVWQLEVAGHSELGLTTRFGL